MLDLQSGKCVRRARRGCSSVGVKVQSVHNGFRVNASTRPEDSKDNNEASKNEPEEMETIQRLKAEDSGKDDADQVGIAPRFCLENSYKVE